MLPLSSLQPPTRTVLCHTPEGMEVLAVAAAARQLAQQAAQRQDTHTPVLLLARDEGHEVRLEERLRFADPTLRILTLPGWDCLPYDRVSPNGEIVSQRLRTLCELAATPHGPDVLILTVSAALQRVPPRARLRAAFFPIQAGGRVDQAALSIFLINNGYHRAATVREPGEYAVRGGLMDIFPAGAGLPVRLDLFGDEVESLRPFDPISQRTGKERLEALNLIPVSEVFLDEAGRTSFRQGYRELFGATSEDDPLYEAVKEGRRPPGVEHWLPLFHPSLETVLDWLPDAPLFLCADGEAAVTARLETIQDYYEARREIYESGLKKWPRTGGGEAVYKPVPPDRLYVPETEWTEALAARPVLSFTPFAQPENVGGTPVVSLGGKAVLDFAELRNKAKGTVFTALAERLAEHQKQGKRVLLAAGSRGSGERLCTLMTERDLPAPIRVESWDEITALPAGQVAVAALDLDRGFEVAPPLGPSGGLIIYSEQDILGERLSRPTRTRRRGTEFISEVSALSEGDLVVHAEHGIGRYEGLETLDVDGAPHDCLRLSYAGGDRLYVPVENIDILSRFGAGDENTQLDKLGAVAWQARKAKVRERVREIADKLLKIAAERQLRQGEAVTPGEGVWDEFCARFPYAETEDQNRAIADVLDDLSSGRPMDRLICGDVGFGKTEVALRAAFAAAMNGLQVAVVAPTTLLARQHHRTFKERFKGLPVRIAHLSRLVPAKDAAAVKQGLADGTVDIVVGTHALLGKAVQFAHLGLLVVDEEQHFGVAQKEKLKQLRANVHVLTLTATPIPRTLQMALAGVRELSLIATPPVDRLAVRSFVLPTDPVVLREAIMREHFRGGQTYYVCPRVADLDRVYQKLRELVPDIRIAVAHGQMSATELERVMTAFVRGDVNLLLSTNIVESGLDIPNANTMIIHRADMFGLAQLYQLRGRIGRSKIRAYCYFTLPPGRLPTIGAKKRLEIMQTLDSLGAGFTLASHDMDIRGAGNLLGDEQSGHIREVGVELYQHMLEEAVAAAREGGAGAGEAEIGEDWTPSIHLGSAVLIPENYVTDLSVRLGLYRRLSALQDRRELDGFAAELVDRFGPLPDEVENLLQVVAIKQNCRRAGVEKVEAGPKGAVFSFRRNRFANPAGLVALVQQQAGHLKLRPDQKLVLLRSWPSPHKRLLGVARFMERLVEVARI